MNNENIKLQKIRKAGSATAKVLKAIKWVCIVCAVLCFVAAIVVGIKKDAVNQSIEQQIAEGKEEVTIDAFITIGTMKVDNPLNKIDDYAVQSIAIASVAGTVLILAAVAFEFLRRIFVTLSESGSPFTKEMLKKLRIVGIIVPIIILSESLVGAAIAALTFWCLYTVFDYGCVLQQSSDETL